MINNSVHEEVFYHNFSCFCEENKWAERQFFKCFETKRKVSLIKEIKNIQDLKRKRHIYSSLSHNDSLIFSFDIENSSEFSAAELSLIETKLLINILELI